MHPFEQCEHRFRIGSKCSYKGKPVTVSERLSRLRYTVVGDDGKRHIVKEGKLKLRTRGNKSSTRGVLEVYARDGVWIWVYWLNEVEAVLQDDVEYVDAEVAIDAAMKVLLKIKRTVSDLVVEKTSQELVEELYHRYCK